MPFGLNIAPRVFTKLTRTMASLLADRGGTVLMYLDDWLLQAESREAVLTATQTTMDVCTHLGFAFNLPKCELPPSQGILWLGMEWDAQSSTLRLSDANRVKVVGKLRRTVASFNCSHRLWARLLGSLNFAAQVVPLGRLWCQRLWWGGNRAFSRRHPHLLLPVPPHLHQLLQQWLAPGLLQTAVPWR